MLTLTRIDVNSDNGMVRLFYACQGALGEEDLAVWFDEDGNAEEVLDPYR